MKKLFLMLALGVFLLTGCSYPTVENPLVSPEECEPCPELHGTFKCENPDTGEAMFMHIGTAGEQFPAGFLKIVTVQHAADSKRPLGVSQFVAFAEPVSDSHIIHVPLPANTQFEQQLDKLDNQWDKSKIDDYAISRLTQTKTGIAFFILDEDFITSQVEAKKLTGRIEREVDETQAPPRIGKRTTVVTAKTDELREYFETTPLDRIFPSPIFLFDRVQ